MKLLTATVGRCGPGDRLLSGFYVHLFQLSMIVGHGQLEEVHIQTIGESLQICCKEYGRYSSHPRI
jgi:hypothetical protein